MLVLKGEKKERKKKLICTKIMGKKWKYLLTLQSITIRKTTIILIRRRAKSRLRTTDLTIILKI